MRALYFFMFSAVIVLALSLPAAAMSASATPVVDSAVQRELAVNEKVPVIIRYKEGYTHEDAVSADGVYAAMGSGFDKRREYKEMNAVAGRISKAALYALKKNPYVETVEYDAVFQISLQDVLPLVSANRAHNATAGGAQVNGFGETVCVLDTGINYTHPDLGGCNATADINNGSCAKVIGGYNYCVDENCSTENSNPLDNHGHGTHVSGIIAANGTIRGVAPGARLVAMKTCNSSGSCLTSDIEAAIRWCTNNATRFNISVISMSLGGGLFQNACDSDDVSLTDAVNNATRFNISVLAAAGNDGNSTSINSPACITNVTAVASSTKTDGISSFSNRNALVRIIAPGSSINSTDIGGLYSIKFGTSMATPAAAGAFALVRAYERLESGTNMTPASIRNALNSTGTPIFDSASNRSYSRINALAAISSIDNTLPNLSISSPANTTSSTANMTLNFTVHDNVLVDRCWYFNATGANNSLASCQNITFFGIEGQNNITVYVNDSNGNTNSSQRFFRIDTIAPAIAIESPANTTFATNNITLNFTASDAALSRCFYSLNGGTNVTIQNCSNITFLAAVSSNNLTVYANDTANNTNSSLVRFSVNISAPILAMQSPENRTYAALPSLNFTVTDDNTDKCWYSLNQGATNTSLANCTNLSSVGAEGFNRLTLYANDTNGNTSSSGMNFTVDTTKPVVTVQSPLNITYNTTNITLNFTLTDSNTQACWYVNATANVSLANCTNITFVAPEGANNITVYANDSAGNTNATQTNFTVDVSGPALSINNPQNRTYNTTNITLNFTASDAAIDRCWFVNTTGSIIFLNSVSGAACSNATFNASEGFRNITVQVNDTGGNSNSSQIFFTADLTAPVLNFSGGPNNEILNTTHSLAINVTASETLSAAILNFNGTTYNMTNATTDRRNWTMALTALQDGNYTFNVSGNDTGGNANSTSSRWVYINATRNVSAFVSTLNNTAAANNVTFQIRNASAAVTNNIIDVVGNYTITFNISSRIVEIVNFTWLTANTSAVINVTANVASTNITAAFNNSGGVLDSVVWADMNNFTSNFTPRVLFGNGLRIFYYINGSRTEPNYTRINTTCDATRSTVPCFELNSTNAVVYLANFSGAAAGNDTKAPNLSVSSPTATTYDATNISLNFVVADNVAVDRCWFVLNGGSNTSLANCTNITFTAAEGTNRLYLYANDTSSNQNASNTNFSVSLPSQGSSGGGGGGGGAATPATVSTKKQTFVFSGAGTIRLNARSNNTALEAIVIETTRHMSASLTVEKLNATNVTNATLPAITYQVIAITAKDFTPAFMSATLEFRVPKSWIVANNINTTTVSLYRLRPDNTWLALETNLIQDSLNTYFYSATTTNFSVFAIAGAPEATKEPEPTTKTNRTEPRICIQVITPATNGTHCLEYNTPCDVPAGWTQAESCESGQGLQEGRQEGAQEGAEERGADLLVWAVAGVIVIVAVFILKKRIKEAYFAKGSRRTEKIFDAEQERFKLSAFQSRTL